MSSLTDQIRCDHAYVISVHALRAIPPEEVPALEAHLATCMDCRDRLQELRRIVDSFAYWPDDVLRPSETLRNRLAMRIAAETGTEPTFSSQPRWTEPDWEQVAPGISCKLLATDAENDRVSMLVRLAPGMDYPPHTHAGCEELHLLDGELWINDRKLYPGDYSRAERGSVDTRVWTQTGCTCVLITSTRDEIGPAQTG